MLTRQFFLAQKPLFLIDSDGVEYHDDGSVAADAMTWCRQAMRRLNYFFQNLDQADACGSWSVCPYCDWTPFVMVHHNQVESGLSAIIAAVSVTFNNDPQVVRRLQDLVSAFTMGFSARSSFSNVASAHHLHEEISFIIATVIPVEQWSLLDETVFLAVQTGRLIASDPILSQALLSRAR